MTQTANIINFERPIVKADKDDGFAPIATRLAQAFASIKISPNQNRVIWAIVTKTYGWGKSFDWICNQQISDITATDGEHRRLAKNKVSEAKTELIKRNILITRGREIGINPVISDWLDSPKKGTDEKSRKEDSAIPKKGQHNPEIGTEQSLNREPQKKETNTKDNYTKDNCRVAAPKPSSAKQKKSDVKSEILALPIPTGLSFSMWKEWVECRSENKKPMTVRSAKMQISKLEEWHAKGHDLDDIVKTSIANNYQGLFEPKGFSQNNANTWQNRKTQNNINVLSDFVRGGNHD